MVCHLSLVMITPWENLTKAIDSFSRRSHVCKHVHVSSMDFQIPRNSRIKNPDLVDNGSHHFLSNFCMISMWLYPTAVLAIHAELGGEDMGFSHPLSFIRAWPQGQDRLWLSPRCPSLPLLELLYSNSLHSSGSNLDCREHSGFRGEKKVALEGYFLPIGVWRNRWKGHPATC